MDSIIAILDQALAALSLPVVATALATVEAVLRFLPTEKPKSILIGVGKIFAGVGALFSKASDLLDGFGLQKLK